MGRKPWTQRKRRQPGWWSCRTLFSVEDGTLESMIGHIEASMRETLATRTSRVIFPFDITLDRCVHCRIKAAWHTLIELISFYDTEQMMSRNWCGYYLPSRNLRLRPKNCIHFACSSGRRSSGAVVHLESHITNHSRRCFRKH